MEGRKEGKKDRKKEIKMGKRTVTLCPALRSPMAALKPAIPAPTIITSIVLISRKPQSIINILYSNFPFLARNIPSIIYPEIFLGTMLSFTTPSS